MFKIRSSYQLARMSFWAFFVFFLIFKIFHYFYEDNYCEVFDASVVQNTVEETQLIKACSNKLVCMLWESVYTDFENVDSGRIVRQRDFSCIRRYEPWVIKIW